jgi:hypothetical protein
MCRQSALMRSTPRALYVGKPYALRACRYFVSYAIIFALIASWL